MDERRPPSYEYTPWTLQATVCSLQCKSNCYDALSYSWGRDDRQENIIISSRSLAIGRNLWSFVIELFNQHGPIDTWADAICIDQGNTTEKNHQVHRMSQIYQAACQVHVWLGSNALGNLLKALNTPAWDTFFLSKDMANDLFDNSY
ncbi:uncharacterized protein A1O5_09507 [Cladophialophora psammophila CBS 110553]|uniref:Heterokaryon incompatibility domain-containing protein n=1 Tax=Cladophialophora psammophila CBS 110553 TaxID=1182543 RepID=W9XAM6_9EURO|nr:uncharacterized protein A1O5_09507 [Cladophialophora psammophila CBS 110553]EXJ67494.1 hypothetical protein A1O5_09507 [Cladophialophora psammophila CBS 110553]